MAVDQWTQMPAELCVTIFTWAGVVGRRLAAMACWRFSNVVKGGIEQGLFNVRAMVLISAEGWRTLMINREGVTLGFGYGDYGGLGHGCLMHDALVPRPISRLFRMHVIELATGFDHSLARTACGEVLSWGGGRDGQLGHGERVGEEVPRVVAELSQKSVVQLAAGVEYSMACTANGSVFSWGCDRFGQLGHGCVRHPDFNLIPFVVTGLSHKFVVKLTAESMHSLVCTADGEVFSWGGGVYGQLGRVNEEGPVPRVVAELSMRCIVQIAAGTGHSLARTADGEVFSWGWGKYGQLGHGGTDNETVPRVVAGLSQRSVVHITAGGSNSMALTANGEVLSWGEGDYGSLGHGGYDNELVPRVVTGLSQRHVVHLAAGGSHSLACTADGEVFSWGYGEFGQLGHGGTGSEPVPRALTTIKHV